MSRKHGKATLYLGNSFVVLAILWLYIWLRFPFDDWRGLDGVPLWCSSTVNGFAHKFVLIFMAATGVASAMLILITDEYRSSSKIMNWPEKLRYISERWDPSTNRKMFRLVALALAIIVLNECVHRILCT